MCGIAGFFNNNDDFNLNRGKCQEILTNMRKSLTHRGPDDYGEFIEKNVALSHTRLSIIDLSTGKQPITKSINDKKYTIVYNGEIYNMVALKNDLLKDGMTFETKTDTEVILNGFIRYGAEFVKKLNGIFAFAIWEECNNKLYIFRDRLGVKPLFYTFLDSTLIFASEIKALFKYPNVTAKIDKQGLSEIFAIGPAKTEGFGVFKDIWELLPGHFITFQNNTFDDITYWSIESKEHTDSYEQTLEKTEFLVVDAIKMQMLSDIPICTFLSGGIDSSIVSAVCGKNLNEELNTFSFDFVDNNKHFVSNSFQPEADRPWVDKMVSHIKSNHTYLYCDTLELYDYLFKSVDAKDLPGMADVDASLLYFCEKVTDHNKVALTGECADEIFGGYPWFYDQKCFDNDNFPWSRNEGLRQNIISKDLDIDVSKYINKRYKESIAKTPTFYMDNETEKRRREISYLNIKWFMQTLLTRMDRASMNVGLEARVPFADHRILEYIWNVPWDMKCKDGIVKGLLRNSSKAYVPEDVLYRKKSPYPKTYNPLYEELLIKNVREVLNSSNEPLNDIINKDYVLGFLNAEKDYGKPWFGQLMAGPQMLAYLLQINYWLKKYNVEIV